jgi:hypothetical protein
MWVIVCADGTVHTDGFCDRQAAENGLRWVTDTKRSCGPHRIKLLTGWVAVRKKKADARKNHSAKGE